MLLKTAVIVFRRRRFFVAGSSRGESLLWLCSVLMGVFDLLRLKIVNCDVFLVYA